MKACLAATADDMTRVASSAYDRVLARHDVDREAAKLAALFARSSATTEA